jgi:galactokinase
MRTAAGPVMKEKIRREFFRIYGRAPDVIARAPGRIEFIGNHTDYNGGTVLGLAIDRSVWVAAAGRPEPRWRFRSDQAAKPVVLKVGRPLQQKGVAAWTNYPLGVLAALPKFGLKRPGGFDFLAMSDLPVGAGLSSSAALELASALAFLELTGQGAPREIVVRIGRHAENEFVGVPCGILDQGVSGYGAAGHVVFIDCRGPRFATVKLPTGLSFWVFNTHTKHALVDGLYAERHRECMAAAAMLGVPTLADASRDLLDASRAKLDPVSARRAEHIIGEIARVAATVAALEKGDRRQIGELLTASHRSSQHAFENSTAELDFLVDALVAQPHVYGARLTGGGFGGAVMAMTSGKFTAAQAKRVLSAYARKFGARPDVLRCRSADGARAFAITRRRIRADVAGG